MIPPLPPPMPPWPGGSKPPWELIREAQQQEGQQGAEGQKEQQPQQQAAPQQQAMLPIRPQVLHGLVPPQMLSPTYPTWITPPPYFRPVLPMQQPVPQQAQVPVGQQQAAPQPRPPQGQMQTAQNGPVRVARTEEKPADPQPFRPVLPVAHPGLPFGARERHYWHYGHLPANHLPAASAYPAGTGHPAGTGLPVGNRPETGSNSQQTGLPSGNGRP